MGAQDDLQMSLYDKALDEEDVMLFIEHHITRALDDTHPGWCSGKSHCLGGLFPTIGVDISRAKQDQQTFLEAIKSLAAGDVMREEEEDVVSDNLA